MSEETVPMRFRGPPAHGWSPVAGAVRAWLHHAEMVVHLVGREFHIRYRRAYLGWLWALAQPLARLLVLTIVFTRILPLGIPDYAVFLFTGLIAWTWFSAGVMSATTSAIDRRDLLLRPNVPRASVPVVSVLADGLDYLTALPVLAVFLVIGNGIPATAVALPVLLAIQLLLTLGIGYACCAANVYLRDVRIVVEVALLLGFYLTPVFYDAKSVPEGYRFLIQLNPMARLLNAYRDILVEGTLPQLGPLVVLFAVCGAIFLVGYAIYRKASPTFVDEL
jgi:lipopolysaccharide transport system permease protein